MERAKTIVGIAGAMRLYIDGRHVGPGTPDTAPTGYALSGSNDLTTGDDPSSPGVSLDFSGGIDEVEIFNRPLPTWEIGLGNQFSRWLPPSSPLDPIS